MSQETLFQESQALYAAYFFAATVNDRSPIGAIPRIQGWRSARR